LLERITERLSATADVLLKESLHQSDHRKAVARVRQSMPLIWEHHKVDRKATSLHRGRNRFALLKLDARIIRSMAKKQRTLNLIHVVDR
jgi:hypothetical protein